jgi:hypothetical protein
MTTLKIVKPGFSFSNAILAAIGLMSLLAGVLLSSLVLFSLNDWWALFILFPGLILFGTGLILALALGVRNAIAMVFFGAGLVVTTVGLMFLFGADWGKWWPLMLMVPGLAAGLLGAAQVDIPAIRAWVRMHLWLGVDTILLGSVFLFNGLGRYPVLAAWYPFHWWGIFILLPGIGAFYNAADAVRSGLDGRHWSVRSLVAFGLAAIAVAAATFLGAGWTLQVALGLAAAGVAFIL